MLNTIQENQGRRFVACWSLKDRSSSFCDNAPLPSRLAGAQALGFIACPKSRSYTIFSITVNSKHYIIKAEFICAEIDFIEFIQKSHME